MKPSENQDFFVVTYLLLFFVGLCGNATVLAFLIKLLYKPSSFHKNLCLILLNLAVADLLTEICGSAAILLENFFNHSPSPEDNILCKIVTSRTLLWIFANISKFHLCFLAWERYRAATKPLNKNNMKRTAIVLVFGWISGTVTYAPFIPYQSVVDDYCIEIFSNHTVSIVIVMIDFVLTFIFPFVFVSCAYYGIIKALRKRAENLAFSTDMPQRVTRVSMLIIISYLLCWAPNYLFYAIAVISSKRGRNFYLILRITYIPAFAASASHPFIYASLSKAYQGQMIAFYQDICSFCKIGKPSTQQSEATSTKRKTKTMHSLTTDQTCTVEDTVVSKATDTTSVDELVSEAEKSDEDFP